MLIKKEIDSDVKEGFYLLGVLELMVRKHQKDI